MSTHSLGFSTGFYRKHTNSHAKQLENMLDLSATAVEIHFTDIFENPELFDLKAQTLVDKFDYRSIHLPAHFKYPSPEAELLVKILKPFFKTIRPHTLVLHPDLIIDFEWVHAYLGDLIAIENMDWRKSFGITITQLEEVFQKLPNAKWVYDVNHIKTLDPTMQLGQELYEQFSNRICHYHLSGFGDESLVHTCLHETRELEIIGAIHDDGKPIIIESTDLHFKTTLEQEWNYVCDNL